MASISASLVDIAPNGNTLGAFDVTFSGASANGRPPRWQLNIALASTPDRKFDCGYGWGTSQTVTTQMPFVLQTVDTRPLLPDGKTANPNLGKPVPLVTFPCILSIDFYDAATGAVADSASVSVGG